MSQVVCILNFYLLNLASLILAVSVSIYVFSFSNSKILDSHYLQHISQSLIHGQSLNQRGAPPTSATLHKSPDPLLWCLLHSGLVMAF